MTERKSLEELAWNVTEEEYRADDALSHSSLSMFAREGAASIPHLKDKKEAEALTYGSLVDCLMTEPDSFRDRFIVVDFEKQKDNILAMTKELFTAYGGEFHSIDDIPEAILIALLDKYEYQKSYTKARLPNFKKASTEIYQLLPLTLTHTLICTEDFNRAKSNVNTLMTNRFTKEVFDINPFDTDIEGFYQLKFKISFKIGTREYPVRCMFDRIIVNHKTKIIYPYDLKTTGKNETDFNKSFLDWRYDLQACMYSSILKEVISKDNFYKDYTIAEFRFVCINRNNEMPLIWAYNKNLSIIDTHDKYGNVYKSWVTLLMEITWHIEHREFTYSFEAIKNNGKLSLNEMLV